MPRLVFEIRYDGSRFAGWQKQPGGILTIQGEIERALSVLARHPVSIIGAGRTDKGVHARQMFFHTDLSLELLDAGFLRSMRGLLGNDIQLMTIHEVHDTFHARFDALSRTYMYYFSFKTDVFTKAYQWQLNQKCIHPITMVSLANLFEGNHDFSSFSKYNPDVANTRCSIFHSQLMEIDALNFVFEIKANRFLHSMVRMLTGALIKVGTGAWSQDYVVQKLNNTTTDTSSFAAPPHALFLNEIHYDRSSWKRVC